MILKHERAVELSAKIPEKYIHEKMFMDLGYFIGKFYKPEKEEMEGYNSTIVRYSIRLMVCDEADYLHLRRNIANAVNMSNILHQGEKNLALIILGKVFDEFEKKHPIMPVTK